MRSLADRASVERGLRIVALVALTLWIANAARPRHGATEALRGGSLAEALPRWTAADPVASVRLHLDTAPDAVSRAWLVALRSAGMSVSWTASALEAVALETYPAVDPSGGVFVLTSAPPAGARVLSDAVGPIDTLAESSVPSISRMAAVEGEVTMRVGGGRQSARAGVLAGRATPRVLVASAAGWEAKFVVAALEESGWLVDARMLVGPQDDVLQGGGGRAGLDTSRHAAVVLLDSASAEQVRGVEAFARAGGGVVLAGDASRAARVAGLLGWRAGRRETAPLGVLPGDTAWRGLSRIPLDTIVERRAVVLESRNGKPQVAARRHHGGRVIAVGYDETWRWRMAGGGDSHADHRDWWSRVVASVAARPVERADSILTGAAPLASLYDALGAPSASAGGRPALISPGTWSHLLGAIVMIALLSEWLLRRSRGER